MIKAGILGGGQLGRMLLQSAANYPVETYVMENDAGCPAAHLCHHFIVGDIRDFDDVYNFGRHLDSVTIEIESVNLEALEKLEREGVSIYPAPSALKIIKNKILQKEFYRNNQIPTSDFIVTNNLDELKLQGGFLPAVHKLALGGYDGKGVKLITNKDELQFGFDNAALLEKMVDIKQEVAVIIAVSNLGEIKAYPPVDMVFDPRLNLLSYQFSPAELDANVFKNVQEIAIKVVKSLNSAGIFAVELFVDKDDRVFVNETAPRVHNSGHHTIEASYSSQFDMMWRIILNFPLGNPQNIMPAAIINLVGEDNFFGEAVYEGLNKVLGMDNVFVHIYGKKHTRPGRKMGHVTVMSREKEVLLQRVEEIKQTLFIKSV